MNMGYTQRIIGVICLIVGIILLVRGHDMAKAIESQFSQVVSGEPTRRTTYFYIAGVALTIFGASQIVWPAKPK